MKTKTIAVLIALVVLISIGSAALVTYLSNRVDQDVIVSSPLVLGITIPDMHAGDSRDVDISVENFANEGVCGRVNINVTANGDDFDCIGITMTLPQPVGAVPCSGGVFAFPDNTYTAETGPDITPLTISTNPALEPMTYNFSTVVRPC